MTVAAANSVNSTAYQPKVATTGASTTSFAVGDIEAPGGAPALTPVSVAGLPTVRLSADQLAMMQNGPRPPDPVKTAAEMNTPAYALVKDAQTGQVLGGVWPGVANVSAAPIAPDSRLSAGSPADQTQALAEDIQRAIGKAVTVQYFQPGDPNAPTFGSHVMGSYWT